jgi:hypothetical protein
MLDEDLPETRLPGGRDFPCHPGGRTDRGWFLTKASHDSLSASCCHVAEVTYLRSVVFFLTFVNRLILVGGRRLSPLVEGHARFLQATFCFKLQLGGTFVDRVLVDGFSGTWTGAWVWLPTAGRCRTCSGLALYVSELRGALVLQPSVPAGGRRAAGDAVRLYQLPGGAQPEPGGDLQAGHLTAVKVSMGDVI